MYHTYAYMQTCWITHFLLNLKQCILKYIYNFFILSGKTKEFSSNYLATPQNLPYDYQSIMHFRPYAYSSNHKPTLQPLNNSIPESLLGISEKPTQLDYLHINLLYGKGKSNSQQCSRCGHILAIAKPYLRY